jgi:hypothetical protein
VHNPISATWEICDTTPAGARYDLVFIFDRPSGNGPMTGFTLLAQQLLAGDLP